MHNNVGNAYRNAGRLNEARSHLEQAKEMMMLSGRGEGGFGGGGGGNGSFQSAPSRPQQQQPAAAPSADSFEPDDDLPF